MPPAAPPTFILGNKPGKLQVRVSGTNQILDVWIDRDKRVWATMPIPFPLRVEQKGDCLIVPLDGITQVVTPAPNPRLSHKQLRNVGFLLLEKLSLSTSVPASGVIFVSRKNGVVAIDPIVWVRDIKTLFFETACATGTTAVGISEAIKRRRPLVRFPVLQPSGISLLVNVKKNQGKLVAEIGGPVKILKKNARIIFNQEKG